MFDQIEKLKQDFTDKYVVVDGSRPELARFDGYTGQVKTVNMSGRALVQFEAWNNIGWYDIDPSALKIVPKPDPAAAGAKAAHDTAKKVEKKSAVNAKSEVIGEKKLSPIEMARQQGAAKKPGAAPAKPAAGGKLSTADILAAARAKKAAGDAPAAEAEEATVTAPAPAAKAKAKPAAAGPAFVPGQKLPVPQIMEWCRAHDAKG